MKTLLLVTFMVLITSCNVLNDTDTSTTPPSGNCEEIQEEALKVLFIGNTYLSQNNIPKLFKDIACSKLVKTKVYEITEHNYRFLDHDANEDTNFLIKLHKWDVVILQNHGQVPSWNEGQLRAESLPHAVSLVDKIKANFNESKIMYMQTWGRKNGDQANCALTPLVCDFTGHTQALETGYEIYADETDGEIALVGNAFELIYKSQNPSVPFNDLWLEDGAHASYLGSYLAAAVLFAKITNSTPVGAMSANGVTKLQTFYLQSVAAQIARP